MSEALKALEQLDKEQALVAFKAASKLEQDVHSGIEVELQKQRNTLWKVALKRVGKVHLDEELLFGEKHHALATRVRDANAYLRRRANRKIRQVTTPGVEAFYRYAHLWKLPEKGSLIYTTNAGNDTPNWIKQMWSDTPENERERLKKDWLEGKWDDS